MIFLEGLRNVRRSLKLAEWFLGREFLTWDEDTPYVIPDVKVGQTPRVEIFSDDGVRLYRYMPMTEKQYEVPLLIVYALINKPYILDLYPERSVIRRFLQAGFDVYLIKWGDATVADQFSLGDYIDDFIHEFVEYIKSYAKVSKLSLLGYCMGGGMSAMYSALYPQNVRNLILMAAPLYFDKEVGGLVSLSDERFFDPEELVAPFGYVPAWFLAERFKILRPLENYFTKYITMFLNADRDGFLDLFFRMERWIHDGVNVAPYAYIEYVRELYQKNALCEGRLFINGKRVDPRRINMPVAAIIGKKDHLTPPRNTLGFLNCISSRDKAIFEADVGHVGLVISARALKVWDDAIKWLSERSGSKIERPI